MSRRKQAKPLHLSPEEELYHTGASKHALQEALGEEEEAGERLVGHCRGDTHVCEKCCAEFFTWSELWNHQSGCEEPPLVLIVKEPQENPGPEDPQAGASPDPSSTSTSSDPNDPTDEGLQGAENSLDLLEESEEEEKMQLDLQPQEGDEQQTSRPPSPRTTQPPSPGVSAAGVPTTNVTLEILQTTRVAVAQFSQGIHTVKGGGRATTAAISAILEHLQALQQQQVLQLQMIEQVRSQLSGMNSQPLQTALDQVTRALPLTPNCYPSGHPSVFTPSIIPSSETMPSAINGQGCVSLTSVLERSHPGSSHAAYGQSIFRDGAQTSTSSETPVAPSSSCSDVSLILPPYTGAYSGVKCTQTLVSSSLLPQGDSPSSSSLPLLPPSTPSSVIFPNPLARIAATANAFEPLALLMKKERAKLPSVSLFDIKPCRDEHFFKHKCRFCSKVFGSDSALQIHLRSHTGERPFKCNICGNRFSTKGNLKVHFQRHKDKYPHVQMNPYPVPEYLDSVPTSQGISYGMSFPQGRTGSLWLDSKPVVATVTASTGLQLPSSVSAGGNLTESISVTPSIKSPDVSVPSQQVSLSPATSTEVPIPPPSESQSSNEEGESHEPPKAEEVHLPQNCLARPTGNSESMATSTAPSGTEPTPEPSAPVSPYTYNPPHLSMATDHFKTGFPFGEVLDSTETSETSKLQKLVENIDRKISDANQCLLCHRTLSCQNALKMHYRVHTGERPFRCKVCGRTFTTKGNLKTHMGVHRASPPLRVQHSCPICQKKFTNAIVLQQHIRLHMAGQISDSPHADGHQGSQAAEKNTDLFSNQENVFEDGNSMEDEEEEEDEMVGNMEEGIDPFKALSSLTCSPPKSFAVVSNIAALENQMKIIDSTSGLNHNFGMKSLMNSDLFTAKPSYTPEPFIMREAEALSKTVSKSSRSASVSPGQNSSEGHLSLSSEETSVTESQEVAASVKSNQAGSSPKDQTGTQPNQPSINKDSLYTMMFQTREPGPPQNLPSVVPNTVPSPADTEPNGYGRPTILSERHQHSFGLQVPGAKSCMWPSGPLFPQTPAPAPAPAPPRRTPKQHNCNMCGKNFSSASALQIHERTHTGEKPFGCSVCGRAFTTKGNLKVHMGTHMWNNSPARRGRRLSVENPMALLGGDAVKVGEMFQKDLAARAMNADAGFWNRYAAAITNSLTLKNHGMSVVQKEGITQLHSMTGLENSKSGGSPPLSSLGNSGINLGLNTHFSMLVDDSKNIGIN